MSRYQLPDLRYQKKHTDPQEALKNLSQEFAIQTSVGIWYFTPPGGRFHEPFVPMKSIEERIEMAARMAAKGVKGIEAHYPDEINADNAHLYEELERSTGMKVAAIPFSHFFDKIFEFGALSSPHADVRERAFEITVEGLRLVEKLGARCAISWPGMDGYRYHHGKPHLHMWDLFESTMARAMDEVPGVMIAIEPKPYEPAANNVYRNTAEVLLACRRIESKLKNPVNRKLLDEGHALVALNPEIGHVKMAYENLPAAYSLCAMEGRLGHTHWNSQPDGNFDQDNNVGVVNPYEAQALLYSLWSIGYEGYFGIDIFPENMPVEKAVDVNLQAFEKLRDKCAKLPHEEILECHLNPRENRGRLEEILIRNW